MALNLYDDFNFALKKHLKNLIGRVFYYLSTCAKQLSHTLLVQVLRLYKIATPGCEWV